MNSIAWLLKWIFKAAIFFTLFAFALNNQGDATVHFFFGQRWTAPMVIIVLCAFALGLMVGLLGMVPRWWRHRSAARSARQTASALMEAQKNADNAPLVPPAHGL